MPTARSNTFEDEDGVTAGKIEIDHEIVEDPRITAIGFQPSDVIGFITD